MGGFGEGRRGPVGAAGGRTSQTDFGQPQWLSRRGLPSGPDAWRLEPGVMMNWAPDIGVLPTPPGPAPAAAAAPPVE